MVFHLFNIFLWLVVFNSFVPFEGFLGLLDRFYHPDLLGLLHPKGQKEKEHLRLEDSRGMEALAG